MKKAGILCWARAWEEDGFDVAADSSWDYVIRIRTSLGFDVECYILSHHIDVLAVHNKDDCREYKAILAAYMIAGTKETCSFILPHPTLKGETNITIPRKLMVQL